MNIHKGYVKPMAIVIVIVIAVFLKRHKKASSQRNQLIDKKR